jgi:hypothetical protein
VVCGMLARRQIADCMRCAFGVLTSAGLAFCVTGAAQAELSGARLYRMITLAGRSFLMADERAYR